ncbi:hypothetical protein PV10_03203 [Exophiala mesophila]|uniref:Uncharacterized protein n=1 Tax=Exophiala mesophila TaxID=212818 RepID=A0A0D1Y4I5_EXOME|nr:uncharacterized protein PV10_03203 [Exophiala mesophila]KIV95566.1 hypothetical protein PV10_03203 [Exophiala mesophila]
MQHAGGPASFTSDNVADINTIADFLACSQASSLEACAPVDVLVLCISAILPLADRVFTAIENRPTVTKTLVLCGGIGHSTTLLYEAVRRGRYAGITDQIQGQPEARVLECILRTFYPRLTKLIADGVVTVVVEDKSTNCGANAIETRKVLDDHLISSRSFIIVQDPTMSLRTLASFQRVYADVLPSPSFLCFPTFVPVMSTIRSPTNPGNEIAEFVVPGISSSELWAQDRFLDMILGEIPRLRDDSKGYGPRGKGFISHVAIPDPVEAAWQRLSTTFISKR